MFNKKLLQLQKSEAGASDEMSEDEEIKLLQKLVKQRRDSAAIFREQNRVDLAEPEEAQAEIIARFLPEQLSEEEVGKVIESIISQTGASSMKDMGKIMGMASKQLAGKARSKKSFYMSRKVYHFHKNGPVVQLDRISDFGSEGWRFESSRGHE